MTHQTPIKFVSLIMKTLIILLTLLPLTISAQEISALLKEKLADSTESPVHGISLLIERQGEIVVNEAVGKQKKNGDALKVTDQYRIASSTKMFVSTIILQLQEESKLELADKIYPYLKEIEYLRLDELVCGFSIC